jgi:hypothetical protein
MAMRLTSAGSLKSSRTSNPNSFCTATKARYLLDDDSSCASDNNSYPGMQLHIPHMQQTSASFQKYNANRSALKQQNPSSFQDEEAIMLQFLNRQQRQDDVRKDSRMPETWSVKLPAYHQSQAVTLSTKTPRKYPPPNSMFRGNAAKVSTAVASSFSNTMEEEEQYYLQERRDPVSTIHEKEDKKRWKPWFFARSESLNLGSF